MITRSLLTAVTALLLAFFLFLLAGGELLKRPLSPEEDVAGLLSELEEKLGSGPDWSESARIRDEVERAWARVEPRIQLSVEKDDMEEFTDQLVRLKAAIEVRDEALAREALALLKATWNRMR